jgi:serine protease Do
MVKTALAVAGLVVAVIALQRAYEGNRRLAQQVVQVEARVDAVAAELAPLRAAVAANHREATRRRGGGFASIARRALGSVYTVETTDGRLGSAFFAWRDGGDSYFITADHVVADAAMAVLVMRRGGSWAGAVERVDVKNDLALVRVAGSPTGMGEPLWSDSRVRKPPLPGDEVLVVGSPYGLEGTITTGVVSRATADLIQTDAAANPGNSGGPVLDRSGRVVGVLVSGGGENINFAIPITRACLAIRDCGA